MSEERKIRCNGVERGAFNIDYLYRARMRGDFDHTAEFFSERKDQWLPLAGIIEDLDSTVTAVERLKQFRDIGIWKVKLLGSGGRGDCPLCKALAKKTYKVDQVPTIPPEGCSCNPWCSLTIVAVN
jgi:hypothetical protein